MQYSMGGKMLKKKNKDKLWNEIEDEIEYARQQGKML